MSGRESRLPQKHGLRLEAAITTVNRTGDHSSNWSVLCIITPPYRQFQGRTKNPYFGPPALYIFGMHLEVLMTSKHHKSQLPQHPDCHPNAPAFHAGAGGFRSAYVLGLDHGCHDSFTIHVDSHFGSARTHLGGHHDSVGFHPDAPGARHIVFGRTPQIKHRARTKPLSSKSRLDLLKEGAKRLSQVGFGNPVRKRKWDNEWWGYNTYLPPGETNPEKEEILQVWEGKSPADAVLSIFKHLDRWSFDCALFVQVVLLYAVVMRLGKEAFNQRVAEHVPSDGKMLLRAHGSTGLLYKSGWQYEKPGPKEQPWSFERTARIMGEQENHFIATPNGSQVVFTNLDSLSNGRDFEHENTIKMGDDQFIAHGIIQARGNVPANPFVTREQIYDALARDALRQVGKLPDDEYEQRQLYISTIVLYGDK